MPEILDERLDVLISKDTLGTMSKAGIQSLVQNGLELLDHKSDGEVAITIELNRRVHRIDLK